MTSDIKGTSTCPKGEESYEYYNSSAGRRIQYDYRTPDGKLFSCVTYDLQSARAQKEIWEIKNRPHTPAECPSKGMFGRDCKNCVR